MLEDESGRIRLVGECVKSASLVTGVIIAVLGAETPNGEFEVVDVCHAGMAPHAHGQVKDVPVVQDDGMDIDGSQFSFSLSHCTRSLTAVAPPEENSSDEWIALVSGLDIGSPSSADAQVQLLIEYLTGEGGGAEDQVSASRISRLIIAGNSLAPVLVGNDNDKKNVRTIHT
jgi:DNA polymerase delta subunit 2